MLLLAMRLSRLSIALGVLASLLFAGHSNIKAMSLIDFQSISFAANRPSFGADLESSLNDSLADTARLQEALDTLIRNPNIRVHLTGHADIKEGSNRRCQVLSERRAKLVYGWLAAHGVDPAQLQGYEGLGASKPIDFTDTESQRVHNRRVDIEVQYDR